MIHLSERLEKIAGFVRKGDRVADIGTDHGYIPIYLKQKGISSYVIAGDINRGPLEKMEENLERYLGDDRNGIIKRLGSGLEVLQAGEVDTVIIAGMGGNLMADILGQDKEKAASVSRFILQPRNAQDKLREWLLMNGQRIVHETLARENRFIWEIICTEPAREGQTADDLKKEYFGGHAVQYEVGMDLIRSRDPLLKEFIDNKIRIKNDIAVNAGLSSSPEAVMQRVRAEKEKAILEGIKKDVYG